MIVLWRKTLSKLALINSTDDLCPWSPWSSCSQSCGAGSVTRRRGCVCEEGGDSACPPEVEAVRMSEETQLCYKQPCPGTRSQNLNKAYSEQQTTRTTEARQICTAENSVSSTFWRDVGRFRVAVNIALSLSISSARYKNRGLIVQFII